MYASRDDDRGATRSNSMPASGSTSAAPARSRTATKSSAHTRVKVVKTSWRRRSSRSSRHHVWRGVSKLGEILDLGVKAGLVENSGSWFSYDSIRIAGPRERQGLSQGQSRNGRPHRALDPRQDRRGRRGADDRPEAEDESRRIPSPSRDCGRSWFVRGRTCRRNPWGRELNAGVPSSTLLNRGPRPLRRARPSASGSPRARPPKRALRRPRSRRSRHRRAVEQLADATRSARRRRS